jgi:uncharacterized membrane protein
MTQNSLPAPMSKTSGRSFASDFRQFFIRGLVILLPSVLTIWILVQAYRFVDQNIAEPLNRLTRLVVIQSVPVILRSPQHHPNWYVITDEELESERQRRIQTDAKPLKEVSELSAEEISGLRFSARARELRSIWESVLPLRFFGLVMAIVLFYLAGRIFGGLIGRRIADRLERLVARIPGFKQIYPHVKQVVDFIFGDRKLEFNRVALVQYPREGIWSLGLVTGRPPIQWTDTADEDLVTLFVPSSPTPFTGYTIAVPRDEVVEIDVTVEEAIRFSVSGGVVAPPDRAALLIEETQAKLTAQSARARRNRMESTLPATSSVTESSASTPDSPSKDKGEPKTGAGDQSVAV